MANNPKKIVDPTEAALSAIQEALKIHDDDGDRPAPARSHFRSVRRFGGSLARSAPVLPPLSSDDDIGGRGGDPRTFRRG